jgi:hypothetical protein
MRSRGGSCVAASGDPSTWIRLGVSDPGDGAERPARPYDRRRAEARRAGPSWSLAGPRGPTGRALKRRRCRGGHVDQLPVHVEADLFGDGRSFGTDGRRRSSSPTAMSSRRDAHGAPRCPHGRSHTSNSAKEKGAHCPTLSSAPSCRAGRPARAPTATSHATARQKIGRESPWERGKQFFQYVAGVGSAVGAPWASVGGFGLVDRSSAARYTAFAGATITFIEATISAPHILNTTLDGN